MLCRNCTSKDCKDKGTVHEPIEIECPTCSGDGCEDCEHGQTKIMDCPRKYCQSVASLTRLSDLFAKGLPPVAGGSLDQACSFIEAVAILENDEATYRAESMK